MANTTMQNMLLTTKYPLQEFLLDLLDSLPRLRLSDQQMRLVIFVLKEAGVSNVPSLQTLRRVQKRLREDVAVPTERRISVKGNVFYVNQLGAQIAQVRELHIHLYRYISHSNTVNRTSRILWLGRSFISIRNEETVLLVRRGMVKNGHRS